MPPLPLAGKTDALAADAAGLPYIEGYQAKGHAGQLPVQDDQRRREAERRGDVLRRGARRSGDDGVEAADVVGDAQLHVPRARTRRISTPKRAALG